MKRIVTRRGSCAGKTRWHDAKCPSCACPLFLREDWHFRAEYETEYEIECPNHNCGKLLAISVASVPEFSASISAGNEL
jgi:hypothetical protein